MFSQRLANSKLADWCRTLASALAAGLPAKKAIENLSRRGHPRLRALNRSILERLEAGDTFADAIEAQSQRLPPLLVSLAAVAGQTGHFPETLREVEDYLRFQVSLRRKFLAQIAWPVLQLVAAVLVIALVIYILGIIESTQGETVDLLGLGLKGGAGALAWLGLCFGSAAALAGGYWAARNLLGRGPAVDRLKLRIPVLGRCLKTLALSRLCFAMHLTLGAGIAARKAVALSLVATDDYAFVELARPISAQLKRGRGITEAFSAHELFPDDFLEVLHSGEETGTIPESLGRLGKDYNERAEHELQMLNTAVGWLVWCLVAAIILFFVFRIFLNYVRLLNEFMPT